MKSSKQPAAVKSPAPASPGKFRGNMVQGYKQGCSGQTMTKNITKGS